MCFSVNSYCFGISLDAGTKLIGVLSLVCSTVTVVVYGGVAVYLPPAAQTSRGFYLLVAAAALAQVLFCAMLLYGAFKSKPRWLWPWLACSAVSCAALLLLSLAGAALLAAHYYRQEVSVQIRDMSTYYFVCAVAIYYCVLVVKSRREEMTREIERQAAGKLLAKRDSTVLVV